MERMRRCASTVKPPIETRAMSSIPRTRATSEIVSGLIGFDWATDAGVCTVHALERAERRAGCVEQHRDAGGARDLPRGDERELVEKALGVLDDADHLALDAADPPLLPELRWNADATPCVTATWSAPDG